MVQEKYVKFDKLITGSAHGGSHAQALSDFGQIGH